MRGYVGTLRLRLEMPWAASLKEKRALVRSVVDRLKARFPLTVGRIDGLDAHTWEVIAIVTVSNDYAWVEETLSMAADFVAAQGEYQISEEDSSIVPLEELLYGES